MPLVLPPFGHGFSRLLASPTPEREEELLRWRPRALTILIWVALLSRLPHMYFLIAGPLSDSLRPMAAMAGAIFLANLTIALARRMNHSLRAWLFLIFQSTTAVMMLLRLGLSGIGRTLLVVPPIYALVLLGRRSGLLWAALSLLLFTAVSALVARGVLAHTLLLEQDSTEPKVWFSAGVGLLTIIVPVSVLLERFVALLQRISDSERAARERLEVETKERQLLEVALMETSERERNAVGHELHDGVCQQLTGALLRCQVAQRSLSEKDAPLAGHLGAIVDLLDESLSQAHDLARGLSPGELEPGALGPAIRELARWVRETHELVCEFKTDEGCGNGLDATACAQVYRIAQEAVTNALKHGKPSHLWIRLLNDPAGVRLEVENDGRSLQSENSSGMGLRIMRNRAERAGGRLALEPRPSGGLILQCIVPTPLTVRT